MSKFLNLEDILKEKVFINMLEAIDWEGDVVSVETLMEIPGVDAIEVVRCKDCLYHNSCSIKLAGQFADDGFCSKGIKVK